MKNTLLFKNYLKAFLLFAFFALGQTGFGQVVVTSVTGTGSPSASYTTLAAAITAINDGATHTGTIVCAVDAGYTETAPAGGFVITATGTSGSTITFIKNGAGANPTFIAPAQTAASLNDAVFKIIGGDFITIDGFTFLERNFTPVAADITAGTNTMTEFGVALFYATTTNGAQNNTIQNCTVTLNRVYQNTFGIYSNSTHTATTVTTSASATGTAGGNSGLKIYGNTVNNVNLGIVVIGPTAIADQNSGIDIGGTSAITGNNITDFGTNATFSGFANVSGTVNGILVRNSNGTNISFNTVSSSNGGVTSGTLNGIQVAAASNAPTGLTFTNTINNNTISLRSGLASGALNGINFPSGSASATSTLNINNNNFNTFGHTVAGTGAIIFILTASTNQFTTINSNTFTNMSVNTSGSVTFISQSFTAPSNGTKDVSGNIIITGFTKSVAGGTVIFITDNGSTVAGAISNCVNNNFSNVTLTGATTLTGVNYTDGGTAATRTVTGNVFNNITSGAATMNLMNFTYWNGASSLSNNTITNINGQGAITGMTIGSTVSTATSIAINGNIINNLVSTGAGGAIVGIVCSNTSTSINISGNTISALATTGVSSVIGISITGALNTNVFKNKIFDLSGSNASSSVFGLNVTTGTLVTLYNNYVGDLRTPLANASNPLIGINVTGGTTVNAYFNTVLLNGSSSGALFGSSAVSISSTPNVTLRNNIFTNNSSVTGAGLAVAYRRSSATLTNYNAASNNNLFFGSNIFTDGTNTDSTLSAYKTRVASRDSNSISENPTFVSTTGSNTNFLHINTSTPTQIESGGTAVSGITVDFDGDIRNASTPDVGADEFAGILLDLQPPVITNNSQSTLACAAGVRVINATITDASGVPTTGAGLPVAYWNSNGGAYTAVTAVSAGSGVYNFTIATGTNFGDVISYYIVAQDAAATPNVTSLPLAGASGFTSNPPAVSTMPTTPFTYSVNMPLSGTYTVGAAGTYSTLTAAINSFNTSCLSGPVVFELIDATYNEAGAMTINSNSTSSATNTLTIRPASGVVATVNATVASGYVLKVLNSYTTINGSNNNTNTRDLTIANLSATSPSVLNIGSTGTTPITSVALRNTNVINGANTATAITISDGTTPGNAGFFTNITVQNNSVQRAFIGIFAIANVATGNGNGTLISDNNLNTSGTNAIRLAGIYNQGIEGGTITNNTIGNFDATNGENDVAIWLATGTKNTTVSNNIISNLGMTLTTTFAPRGIYESSGLVASGNVISNNTITNISTGGTAQVNGIENAGGGTIIERNKVTGIINNNTSTYGAYGINVSGNNNSIIRNNFVSNINGNMSGGGAFDTTFGIIGIRIAAGTGHQVYFNSVNLYGIRPGTATSSLLTAAFALVSTASTSCDVRNNIFANNITGGTTSIANVSIFLPSGGTSAMNLNLNNNLYYYGTDTARSGVGQGGTTAGTNFYLDLTALLTYSSTLSSAATNDNASFGYTTAVPYTSATDLHITTSNDLGVTIPSVPLDIDLFTRTATPDIGAHELSIAPSLVTWTGATSTLWSVATNWNPNFVPDATTDVLINTIAPNAPFLNVDYTVATGKTLTVSGSGTLTVNPTRTLTIAGTAAFNDKPIILKSDATGTASIGQVTGILTGATNVTVERYIAGRRAFRFLTPSVTTTTSIRANWQNAGLSTAGIGTQITGSTTGANGFDLTVSGNPSLATYNAQVAAGTGFVNASNTDVATLAAGVGYRVLVRGDRNVDLTATSADNMNVPTTLSAKGTLTTGAVSFTNSAGPVLVNNQSLNTQTNGYTLIGNPYASPVDWNAVTKTGVKNNAYYSWDPTLGTAAQRGRYVVYSADSGLTNLYDDNSVLSQTNRRYLQTGQAVFIKNTVLATSATLTFNEANKASVNSFVFRTNEQAVTVTGSSSLYLTVYDSNELAIGAAPIDGSVALFGTVYNNALDANDVDKLTTSGENLAFARENKNLAIETLAPVVANDELFVKTVQFQANKNYTFRVNTANFDTAVTAKMVDLYLNTETAIDLTQPSFVTFATTADATSYGADRFKIVFNNAALGNGSFNASTVAIYPNPIANNEFTIALPNSVSGNVTVKMSNMLGQEVYSRTAEATTTMQIQPKQQLEEGVYVVSISNNGQVIQAKVIVKN